MSFVGGFTVKNKPQKKTGPFRNYKNLFILLCLLLCIYTLWKSTIINATSSFATCATSVDTKLAKSPYTVEGCRDVCYKIRGPISKSPSNLFQSVGLVNNLFPNFIVP